ncbi:MAG: major capsid protein [Desulfuromonadaceae bacterium]
MLTRFKTLSFWTFFIFMSVTAFTLCSGHHAMAAGHGPAFAAPLLMFGVVNIRNLFSRDAIIRYLQILGPQFPTVVCDTVFKDRPQQPGPLIGSDIIKQSVKAMPLARRGSRSINIGGPSGTTEFYEPFPIHPDIAITGAELNNLRLFMQGGDNSTALLNTWAQGKTDILRRTVRNTCEAMCATALSGTLSWPVQIEGGGFETYSIVYGTNLTLDPANYMYWDDPKIKVGDVQRMLIDILVQFQLNGTGQDNIFWAGKDAFLMLFNLVTKVFTTSKLNIDVTANSINFNGTTIALRSEQYWDPQAKIFKPILAPGQLKVIDLSAGHRLPYAAIDDLDGNLQPMPFFIKPLKTDNPSGYSLIAESKPLPVVNPLGICDITVIAPV